MMRFAPVVNPYRTIEKDVRRSMAKQAEISRRELLEGEGPDALERAWFVVAANRNLIMGLVAAVAVVLAVAGVVGQKKENRLAAASDQLFKAFTSYDKAIREAAWASTERKETMAKVRGQCDLVINQFPDTPAARNALFLKGNAYYFEGDNLFDAASTGKDSNTQKAIDAFELYRSKAQAEGDNFELAGAMLSLGLCNENLYLLSSKNPEAAKNRFNAAMAYYDDIVKLPDVGFLADEALLAKARLLAFQGDKAKAIEICKDVWTRRGDFAPEPDVDAPASEKSMYRLRQMSQQYSLGNNARIRLLRLGVDTDKLAKEMREAKEPKPAAK